MAVKKRFSSFQEMLSESELPVLVDFYAPWCGPCHMMTSILEEVNTKMSQQVRIVKINGDVYPSLASQYQVGAYPTLLLFKDGQMINRIEGVVSADQLMQQVRSLI